jgi:hypothetical protein
LRFDTALLTALKKDNRVLQGERGIGLYLGPDLTDLSFLVSSGSETECLRGVTGWESL